MAIIAWKSREKTQIGSVAILESRDNDQTLRPLPAQLDDNHNKTNIVKPLSYPKIYPIYQCGHTVNEQKQ